MVANPRKYNDENDYVYEVVWCGSKQVTGRGKGELLGAYESKSILNTNHPYVARRIRGKIVSIQQPIIKESDDYGED